ncbi:MAG TPA: hypothetical protein VF395_12255 [Polyangiaceae bacterium]
MAAVAVGGALGLTAASASANPRPLPFTYPHEQLAEGATELEQFGDFTPVRASSPDSGNPVWFGLFQFQTEFEHGITDRLELGLYLTYQPAPPASDFTNTPGGTQGNGLKQRLRDKLADTGAWPIDVSLHGELAENEHEFEVEGKVILQRRFGVMRLMANLTAEQGFDFDGERDVVLAPSGGATFEVTPSIQPGIEWWMRGEFPETHVPASREFELGPHQYVGPALLLQFGPLWWTNGVYLRVSDFGHTLQPAESYGNVWIRSVIGIGL